VDEQWRKRLLEAANAALDRLRAPDVNTEPGVVVGLERLRARLEALAEEDERRR
jgi:hypothetical protein